MAFFEQEIHDAPTTFLSKYVFSFDHKAVICDVTLRLMTSHFRFSWFRSRSANSLLTSPSKSVGMPETGPGGRGQWF